MATKKIGKYLTEHSGCDEDKISAALAMQAHLTSQGRYAPIGRLMLDADSVTPERLEHCLRLQRIDILSSVSLFSKLPSSAVEKIADVADYAVLPPDQVLFREGDPGDTFCVIISGSVRVFRTTEDDCKNILTTLTTGSCFGEMALLTGEPRSASVETLEPTSLITIEKNALDRVLADNPELTTIFLQMLAGRLSSANETVTNASVTERAYQRFVSEQSVLKERELLGKSRALQKLRSRINEAAAADSPVLITGDEGTEKRTVAAMIHQGSSRKDGPLLIFDARNVAMITTNQARGGVDAVHAELSQECALFGHNQGAFSFARTRRMGLLEVGNGGTVVIDHADHLAKNVQAKLADFMRTGRFSKPGSSSQTASSVRIIATLTSAADAAEARKKLHGKLGDSLGSCSVHIPPIRERRKDLRQIVEHLIAQYSSQAGKPARGIDAEGFSQIMQYPWPGNMDELAMVLRRAVNIASSETITAEDLFIGSDQAEGKFALDLLKIDGLRSLLQSRRFPGLVQVIAAAAFAIIISLGLWGSQATDNNMVLALIWGVGEPAMVLGWLVIGRAWCGVCPMGALSEQVGRLHCAGLKVPPFLKKYGFYLSAMGLTAIILAEISWGIYDTPRYTAMLLLVITLCAATSGLLFQRRVWCRHMCPFGRWSGVMASLALTELRPNRSVCNNDCTTHSCYVGDGDQPGCPMFEGTFAMQSNRNCILCGNCIKLCKNNSPRLNLRQPGQELVAAHVPDRAMAVFILFLMGTELFRGLNLQGLLPLLRPGITHAWIEDTAIMAAMIALSFLCVQALGALAFRGLNKSPCRDYEILCYGLLPSVLSFEVAYQLHFLLKKGVELVPAIGQQAGIDLGIFAISISSGWTVLLQMLSLLIGALSALLLTKKLLQKHGPEPPLPAGKRSAAESRGRIMPPVCKHKKAPEERVSRCFFSISGHSAGYTTAGARLKTGNALSYPSAGAAVPGRVMPAFSSSTFSISATSSGCSFK